MANPVKISVLGASGRMGRMLLQAIIENENTILVGASEKTDHDWVGKDVGILVFGKENGIIVSDQPIDVILASQAIIDFTHPDVSVVYSALAAQARIVHVIGTTGFSKNQLETIELAAQHATIIKAGNMSLGVTLLTQLTRRVAKALDEDYDIEILEMHHNKKLDAPSGTALMLGEAAASGRDTLPKEPTKKSIFELKSERKKGEIGFASLRGGDVVGEHDVIFSASGERIILRHVATDRMIFARGAVKAAIWGVTKGPSLYNMVDVLGLND
jgi:4-hydroxy-tetrahydrodipicolinate reductase